MPTANCATAECAAGIMPNRPLSQGEIDAMRNGAADFAGEVSTGAGRFSAAAAAYGAILAGSPNLVTAAGASTQFGFAGTAGIVSFLASAAEQILRPNPVSLGVDSVFDLTNFYLSGKYPLLSTGINETSETIKNLPQVNSLTNVDNG